MSKYSGKCDLADTYYMREDSWDFNKVKIYIGNNIIPLRIDCEKDLVPYFPYLEGMMYGDKEELVIKIGNMSFVDAEEKERITWYKDDVIKKIKRFKRKKLSYTLSDIVENSFFVSNEYKKVAEKILEDGYDADLSDIHTSIHDYYRNELYKKMLEVGYKDDEAYIWCFGFVRWANKKRKEEENENG